MPGLFRALGGAACARESVNQSMIGNNWLELAFFGNFRLLSAFSFKRKGLLCVLRASVVKTPSHKMCGFMWLYAALMKEKDLRREGGNMIVLADPSDRLESAGIGFLLQKSAFAEEDLSKRQC